MVLELEKVAKRYGDSTVLEGVGFSVDAGEIVSIVGPSGSGKTTLLKLIAGMEPPTSGTIRFDRPITRHHPVILVFQDYVLFPHMTIFDNVAFGLRARKVAKKEIDTRVRKMLEYFDIEEKAKAYPAHISGGQRQRVAIARSLVINPHILLLDEPFANLDRTLKMGTADFIRTTQKEFGTTTISVTHDLEEAFAMSDRIGILIDGKLQQFDHVRDVYFAPSTVEAAMFLGPVNHITPELMQLLIRGDIDFDGEEDVWARAEGLEIIADESGVGRIHRIRFLGLAILYEISINDSVLSVYSLTGGFNVGDKVSLRIKSFFNAKKTT